MREHGKRAAAWFLTVVMVITMIVPYGGAGIPFAGRVKAADLIDLSGKDGAHTIVVGAADSTYNGQAIETEVEVKVDGDDMELSKFINIYVMKDYTVTITRNAEGKATKIVATSK